MRRIGLHSPGAFTPALSMHSFRKPFSLVPIQILVFLIGLGAVGCSATIKPVAESDPASASGPNDPEAVVRLLIEANANKDLDAIKQHMGTDASVVGYTIGGRKYVGWEDFARVMSLEFASVDRLEIPITYLKVWQHNDVAWFAMEIDYTRLVTSDDGQIQRTVIPLRETGVLERRKGKWLLVNWHESLQEATQTASLKSTPSSTLEGHAPFRSPDPINLSGEWEIQEEDKSYQATLDEKGNGSYTWQDGVLTTTSVSDGLWAGTWAQQGNDREGEFEVLLSEDLETAQGVWWYTRVGEHQNIPPREWGGSYIFKRISGSHTSNNSQ